MFLSISLFLVYPILYCAFSKEELTYCLAVSALLLIS
nr:MAG TPA: hypothetical protein [Crassvirales sp.]